MIECLCIYCQSERNIVFKYESKDKLYILFLKSRSWKVIIVTSINFAKVGGIDTKIPKPDVLTDSDSMYDVGWNLICVSDDDTTFSFTVFKNGATTEVAETKPASGYMRHTAFGALFGGFFNEAGGFNTTFKGILHTAFLKSEITPPNLILNWQFPRTTGSQL